MAELRALTVRQPWAHMIAFGGKQTENRTWSTPYRGLLAIHAGAYSGWDKAAETFPPAVDSWRRLITVPASGLLAAPLSREAFQYVKFGAVIAVADLAGCHHESTEEPANSCSPWGMPGCYHWSLANVRALREPVPVRGKLGLWRLPDNAEKAVLEQLEAGS